MLKLFSAACILLFVVGCGPSMGEITGEVVYKGKPVPGGLITFRPEDPSQNSVAYELDRDGKFKIELPAGEITVCIDNREFEPRPATAPAIPPGVNLPPDVLKSLQTGAKESSKVSDRWVKLPEKYYQMETSDIKFTVKGGPQTEVIEFKD